MNLFLVLQYLWNGAMEYKSNPHHRPCFSLEGAVLELSSSLESFESKVRLAPRSTFSWKYLYIFALWSLVEAFTGTVGSLRMVVTVGTDGRSESSSN